MTEMHSPLDKAHAAMEAKAKGQRVAQTLPEDQIPQFFKIDESLSSRSLAKTVSDFADDDPANWLSEEYIAAWKREAESKAYDPPSSDESQEQERITIRERVQSAHRSLGKTNQALQGKAETSAQLPRSKQTLLPIWITLIFLGMAILLLLFQK